MSHAPETSTRKLEAVSGTCVMQSAIDFFWCQNLALVFYLETETGKHVIKIVSSNWSLLVFRSTLLSCCV